MAELLTRRFTTDQYHQMLEVGIIQSQERVELIDGEIVTMSPVGLKHVACINRLNQIFSLALAQTAIVSIQNPIQLGDSSEPQLDVALLKARPDFYQTVSPQAGDVLLLVEVADSSLRYDQSHKLPLYAQNHIPEVWIVNLNQNRLLVYRCPQNKRHQQQIILEGEQSIGPLCLPDLQITVAEIVGSSVIN